MRKATDTVLRHLAMLASIPVRPNAKSTREIREDLLEQDSEYDVSVRSIQRSLEMLSTRFPIASEMRGRGELLVLDEQACVNPAPFHERSDRICLEAGGGLSQTDNATFGAAPAGSVLQTC